MQTAGDGSCPKDITDHVLRSIVIPPDNDLGLFLQDHSLKIDSLLLFELLHSLQERTSLQPVIPNGASVEIPTGRQLLHQKRLPLKKW
jgi:hypothetical protein